MPDGKRKRRHSCNQPKRDWYAQFRSWRFARRFGAAAIPNSLSSERGSSFAVQQAGVLLAPAR